MTFRPGDRALCIQAHSSGSLLEQGTLYYVTAARTTRPLPGYPQEQFVFLLGHGPEQGWNASRFRRVDGQDRLYPHPGAFDKYEEEGE